MIDAAAFSNAAAMSINKKPQSSQALRFRYSTRPRFQDWAFATFGNSSAVKAFIVANNVLARTLPTAQALKLGPFLRLGQHGIRALSKAVVTEEGRL